MGCDAFPQGTFDFDILRNAPIAINRICCLFRKSAVAENQTACPMNGEISVNAEYLIIFRFAERLAGFYRVHKMKIVQRRVIRLYNGPFKNTQFLYGPDFFPVQRFLKSASVICQHDNNTAAVQSGPFFSGCEFALKIQIIQTVFHIIGGNGVAVINIQPMFYRFFGGTVNDLGEQAVSFIQTDQFQIIRNHFAVIFISSRVIL